MTAVIVLIVILALLVVYGVAQYNGLVSLRRQTQNAFGQIDVQLKRRYDLIPNLVETVKGYMKHEQDTLEKVIQARNQAMAARGVGEKAAAESQLSSVLGGIMAISESYPELRSNQNMLSLQEELKSTENKISFARQYYNDIVTAYNTRIESFPSSIFATSGGFKPQELFEIEDAIQRENVKVQF
ncbi:LemA family protein [Fimbriimonas ginsengisoli]|uniref:LemA protein n=1 Tax=Fimbriimonas ginsengisoli Gsoil 348 TaxID=661478 RepID=A0A068NUS6_FIMGI|nr:LemA family protein [Fimbriimonas ginsengisoli]AIE87087.1 LemA protein [Fimbriimonas ginsengisoli Gsoil 348]